MVLRGLLSNHFEDLLQSLTSNQPHQVPAQDEAEEVKAHGGWPDGRRKFGSVSGAVAFVLSQTESDLRMKDIYAAVEHLLGGEVSSHSVSDYLQKHCKPPRQLFERTRRGHYRLLR